MESDASVINKAFGHWIDAGTVTPAVLETILCKIAGEILTAVGSKEPAPKPSRQKRFPSAADFERDFSLQHKKDIHIPPQTWGQVVVSIYNIKHAPTEPPNIRNRYKVEGGIFVDLFDHGTIGPKTEIRSCSWRVQVALERGLAPTVHCVTNSGGPPTPSKPETWTPECGPQSRWVRESVRSLISAMVESEAQKHHA